MNMEPHRIAWTGGSIPTRSDKQRPDFRALRRALFREQVAECGGLDLWACAGTSALDRARIFWNRATLDAHATLRHAMRTAAKQNEVIIAEATVVHVVSDDA